MEIRRVVTVFLRHEGRVLILKRSNQVGTYRGRWAGVSGYLEGDEKPIDRALEEIREETGLAQEDVGLNVVGEPLPVLDEARDVIWVVHPFLFEAKVDKIRLDWEHEEYRWMRPEEIDRYETVPKLKEALERVFDELYRPSLAQGFHSKLEEIRSDRRHGASWLSREALMALEAQVGTSTATSVHDFMRELRVAARELMRARPSIASITNLAGQLLYRASERSGVEQDLGRFKTFIIGEIQRLVKSSEESVEKAAEQAAQLMEDGDVVLTHSLSATVEKALEVAHGRGKRLKVIATESRPLFEGRKLAESLGGKGISVMLIVDSAVGDLMREADLVLVGADSVLADGSIVNKVGTYLTALAAYARKVPFYSACETAKFDPRSLAYGAPGLEEGPPSEVLEGSGLSNVEVRNVYFDITPSHYVTGIATEDGIMKPSDAQNVIKKAFMKAHL